MFKRVHNLVPSYLMNAMKLNSDVHVKSTRYSGFNLVCYKRKIRTFDVSASLMCQMVGRLMCQQVKFGTVLT